jgi:hypothetical protein
MTLNGELGGLPKEAVVGCFHLGIRNIMWYIDPLQDNNRERSSYITAVAKQWPRKQACYVGKTCAAIEEGCFLCDPCRDIISKTVKSEFSPPCGGGVEYLHRDPASRRRRRKGKSRSETVKYGRKSYGTRTRKWLRWRRPAGIVNDRPVLSSERAPNINKPATVKQ